MTRVLQMLEREKLIVEESGCETLYACRYNARSAVFTLVIAVPLCQSLVVRGDEGFLLSHWAIPLSVGYGRNHPFAGEIRTAEVDVFITPG